MTTPHKTLNLPQTLNGGLVMRLATPSDAEALAAFNKDLHENGDDPPDSIKLAILDLMSGRHPTTSVADFVLIEDTSADNKIVSTTCLIPQTWSYDGILFLVGQPEFVGTDAAYRRQGLSRAIFEQIHALSQAYGHQVQCILGIPWFYRQFEYEYALAYGGSRTLPVSEVPDLAEGEAEAYQIRPASQADIPDLLRLYNRHRQNLLITTILDEAHWRYGLSGTSPGSITQLCNFCILNATGQIVGYYQTSFNLWERQLPVYHFMVDEGVSMQQVLPPMLRALKKQGQEIAAKNPGKPLRSIRFQLPLYHPVFDLLDARLGSPAKPYAVYLRVPDLPTFLNHIAPVLEKRLAQSALVGYTQTVNITFYRGGVQLIFAAGKLVQAVPWQDPGDKRPQAGFPPGVFLQLLFGYRSLAELRYAFPDCWASDGTTPLLNILFPKQPSWMLPYG